MFRSRSIGIAGIAVLVTALALSMSLGYWELVIGLAGVVGVALCLVAIERHMWIETRGRIGTLRQEARTNRLMVEKSAQLANESLAHSEQSRAELTNLMTRTQEASLDVRKRLGKIESGPLTGTVQQVEALIQIYARFPMVGSMPLLSRWSMDPVGISLLLRIIREQEPRLILELGSGTSTVWMGYAMREQGRGRLVSIEHLPEFHDLTQRYVREHGLNEYVDLRLCQLTESGIAGHSATWYDLDGIQDVEGIDLLVVDGPPGHSGPEARYPALPLLASRLRLGAVVVLDDAERDDEERIVERWTGEGVGFEVSRGLSTSTQSVLVKVAGQTD